MNQNELLQLLDQYFDSSELQGLCFELGIEYDNLRGQSKIEKARELISFCERHLIIPKLLEVCSQLRPFVNWSTDLSKHTLFTRPLLADLAIVNVLVILANPRGTNTIQLKAEEQVIRESIRSSRHRDHIFLEVRQVTTIHEIRQSLLDKEFQIVHLSGYGTGTGLVLENISGGRYVVPQRALAELLQAHSPPIQCCILNACYSLAQDPLTSFEIPFTIVIEGGISNNVDIEFCRGFYDAIGAGREADFAYEEGRRTVQLATPNAQSVSKLIRSGQTYTADTVIRESAEPATYADEPVRFDAAKAIVGLGIDLSGSMNESIQNDTGDHMSRLEGVRQSLNRLMKEAQQSVHQNANDQIETTIDVFAYGFGLRSMAVCDLFALIKAGQEIITKDEIEALKNQYVQEMQDRYSGYEGTRGIFNQLGLGSLVAKGENILKAISEDAIRKKILLEIKSRLDPKLQTMGDLTLPIEDVADLWADSDDVLDYAEELLFGNTPMTEALTLVNGRFNHELQTRDDDTTAIFFLISDGEPTDGDPLPLADMLQSLGVTVISCFVTNEDIANPRVLYSQSEPQWGEGAKLMFAMASTVAEDSQFIKFLLRKGWIIDQNAKLFVQLNHSEILEEFIRVVLSPLQVADDSQNLPRGI